jgi:hypothetical protein
MLHRHLGSIALSWIILSNALATARSAEDGWVVLFDAQTLNGWTQKNGTATYRVDGETIVGQTEQGSPNSFLCTNREYGDFELTFDVKVDSQLNSGVQIRSRTKEPTEQERNRNQVGRVYGPQVEIEAGNDNGSTAGYIYGEATGRGWLTPDERRKLHMHFVDGQWNSYRIVAQGPRIQTFLNGHPIEDLTDEAIYQTHPRGFIGLQVHAIGSDSPPLQVAWRNIRLREL